VICSEYLKTGGPCAIGPAGTWMGVRLRVKPVVSINHQTGLVEPAGLIEMMWSKFRAHTQGRDEIHVAVLDGDRPQVAEALAARAPQDLHAFEILINGTRPVLGVNMGPRALALCGYGAARAS
jgi:fatty acid-binding protein DegV